MVRRGSKTIIKGLNTDNLPNLRMFEEKRAQRFTYDPHRVSEFLHHFSGTITSVVLQSWSVWLNMVIYIVWLAVDERLGNRLHCVDPAVLSTPGALFIFFITGQLGRAIARYNTMKSKARGIGKHVKTATFLLSSAAGDRMDSQTLTKIKAIVSRANAAHMFFMMSMSEDRYLDVVYPEWFVANGLLDPSFSPSKRPAPGVHFQQLHKAMSLLNSLARTESAQIIDRLTFDQARMELNSALQEMIGLTGALADSTPPSMHYFGSVFLVCYLPLVSISIAQMKAESEIDDEELDIQERYFSFALGGLAVALINFAFFGMFHLVGTVYHPFGCDAEDVPIFSLADSTQKACTAILGYATADMSTESPEEDDEVYATTDGFTRSPGGAYTPGYTISPGGKTLIPSI